MVYQTVILDPTRTRRSKSWQRASKIAPPLEGDRTGGRVAHTALVRVQTRNDDEA